MMDWVMSLNTPLAKGVSLYKYTVLLGKKKTPVPMLWGKIQGASYIDPLNQHHV